MGRESRKTRFLSEITNLRELREARRELELREFFARERLAEDARDTFTLDNLISLVAPPGSIADRVIGGVGSGIATVQGIIAALGSFAAGGSLFGRRTSRTAMPAKPVAPVARTPRRHASDSRKSRVAAPKKSTTTRKRRPEIEAEVELDPKPKLK